MKRKYTWFIPFRSEQDWWQNFSDLADCTCARCGMQYPEADMAYGAVLCNDCRAKVDSARVEIVEGSEDECEEWCERREKIESWLASRGL